MPKPKRTTKLSHLVRIVAPLAAAARSDRLINRYDHAMRSETVIAPFIHPLDVALAKWKSDNRYAAERKMFVKKVDNDVYISGDVFRERKQAAQKEIRRTTKEQS